MSKDLNSNKIDFLAIGDIVTDAFIRIKDASVHCDINKKNCQICMRFGDKIPYESVTEVKAVGNSPNAAVSAARLGLKSALATNIGSDREGEEAIETLEKEKVHTGLIKTHAGEKTNYHYVLWYEDERTILIKHTEFNYQLPVFNEPRWIYLSSLAENSVPFHHEIASYLTKHPQVKLAFQPGTFQIKLGSEELGDIYKVTEVFFCNVEEAHKILNSSEGKEIGELIKGIHQLGPKIVVITDGPNGAYGSDGKNIWQMPIYPDPAPPLDRTGAGDSFSSTFTSALALGKSIPEALAWAPINSMSVVQKIGAQAGLLKRSDLEEFLKKAPTEYKAKKI